ncbi:X-Pro dipeptidyl-peptidase [Rhodopirellula baltica WH47]|uniref:X-Pro dipeptidyl-peptidase n=1 Tax=Rhodopirellula baltica WH47 TaxID=991778 RepID=F2APL1_RHOBT|nr:X-Pro dipeptidyl-peptidase [Rhodopirellula baltica WH47]
MFSAKGRDGETDIWGLACFPEDYDASSDKKYPVVEYIYAGPHDSHVPKSFRSAPWHRAYLDAGFIVVQIDGMGTANRSKAFHDVCWHNLKDAGFPDRIAWMKALAKEHPAMDLERVGIFGTSAGGQNTGSALLFHGDFYDAGVAACGCHDNRMDKASWNEQWMGYPVGDHYSECSNIDNAANLVGDLFLIVGELDTNVPPESTLRFADALIKAGKDFDMLVMPGVGHSDGGAYGKRRTLEFFIEKLKPGNSAEKSTSESTPEIATPLIQTEKLQPQTAWMDIQNHYQTDLETLKRRLPVRVSEERLSQTSAFLKAWESKLQTALDAEGDEALSESDIEVARELQSAINDEKNVLKTDLDSSEKLRQLAPFVDQLISLTDLSNRVKPLDGQAMAADVQTLNESLPASMEGSDSGENTEPNSVSVSQPVLDAAADLVDAYESWQTFYEGYHPDFNWWVLDLAKDTGDKLRAWKATLKVDEELTKKQSEQVASDSSALPAPAETFVFGEAYPPIQTWSQREATWMPTIVRRFTRRGRDREKKAAQLPRWKEDLAALELDGKPFEEWSLDDQVDWHLLTAEVDTQIERKRIEDSGEKLPPATSSVEKDLSGTPVGRERIELELRRQFIDHSPEELIELAEREYAIVRSEMVRVAQDMGLGDDWKAAVERMKNHHVAPGQQPVLIGEMAEQSVDWLRKRDWITVPPFADYCWRMIMMTPERQKVNPFFTGGEVISVSFPTSEMSPSDKRQSLRGNNIGYARATVHHELIPGHHLQMFSNERYQPHRRTMSTPFWLEGLAVYWELKLYDDGFARTPEERMGMLVWRAHRCARIIFSLNFHLGRFSPDQCVDFLVDNVGFERRNATAEVRRSIGPSYPPLYQAAYMLGALQIRQLHREMVLSGEMTEREFHDSIMEAGMLPIAMLREILKQEPLQRDEPPRWKFN